MAGEREIIRFLLGGVFVLLGAGCGPSGDEGFGLELLRDPNAPELLEVVARAEKGWIEVVDPTEIDWESVLTLRLVEEEKASEIPVLGTYELRPFDLIFRPVYPLLPGKTYVARFEPAALPGFEDAHAFEALTSYEPPDRELRGVPRLTGIYPTERELPANHLKFYLVFSEPMRRGNVFDYLKLVGSDGIEVVEPFRDTELWSEDGRRLTLWLHPGRQKEGVNLNVDLGPVLREGVAYRLVVSGDWKSTGGKALGEDYEKAFRAGPVDRIIVDVNSWQLKEEPRSGTGDRLRLFFKESYDWALLQSMMRVETAEGKPVEGTIEVGMRERSWFFIPAKPWEAGNYRIAVDTLLEDLAGNSLARPFEVDLDREKAVAAADVVYITFRAR